jgi:hypothetical protein
VILVKKYVVSLAVNETMEIEAEDKDNAFDLFQEWFEQEFPKYVEVEEVK